MAAPQNAISDPLKALLGLFDGDLRELKFPDVDAQVLTTTARAVVAAAESVAEAEAALEAAREELQRHQDALLHKAQRALAYARVYAEEQPELLEKLALITLPRPPRRASAAEQSAAPSSEGSAPRRRGRPPKQRGEAPNLFADPAVESAPGAPPLEGADASA